MTFGEWGQKLSLIAWRHLWTTLYSRRFISKQSSLWSEHFVNVFGHLPKTFATPFLFLRYIFFDRIGTKMGKNTLLQSEPKLICSISQLVFLILLLIKFVLLFKKAAKLAYKKTSQFRDWFFLLFSIILGKSLIH